MNELVAVGELQWFWLQYPAIIGVPGSTAVVIDSLNGLRGCNASALGTNPVIADAIERAWPIRQRLALLKMRQRKILRWAYDPSSRPEREPWDRVATACRLPGDIKTRGPHAMALVGRALRAYCGAA
jgi:hypothetical protein